MHTTQPISPPDALIFVSPACPHCPSVLENMVSLLKEGVVGRLEIINVAVHPEQAAAQGVRTVPWLRIGQFELEGLIAPDVLRRWAEQSASTEGIKSYFVDMLKIGRRDKVERMIRSAPRYAELLVDVLGDADASMAVRIGMGAVLEELHGTGLTDVMIPGLGELALHGDDLVRADACHFLTLIGGAAVIPYLTQCSEDENPDIREMAQEALVEGNR